MYKIEITDETAEAMFRDILIQDYKGLVKDIDDLESRLQDLKPYEFEDLCADRRFKEAIKIMMEYYLAPDQMKAVNDEDTNSK